MAKPGAKQAQGGTGDRGDIEKIQTQASTTSRSTARTAEQRRSTSGRASSDPYCPCLSSPISTRPSNLYFDPGDERPDHGVHERRSRAGSGGLARREPGHRARPAFLRSRRRPSLRPSSASTKAWHRATPGQESRLHGNLDLLRGPLGLPWSSSTFLSFRAAPEHAHSTSCCARRTPPACRAGDTQYPPCRPHARRHRSRLITRSQHALPRTTAHRRTHTEGGSDRRRAPEHPEAERGATLTVRTLRACRRSEFEEIDVSGRSRRRTPREGSGRPAPLLEEEGAAEGSLWELHDHAVPSATGTVSIASTQSDPASGPMVDTRCSTSSAPSIRCWRARPYPALRFGSDRREVATAEVSDELRSRPARTPSRARRAA